MLCDCSLIPFLSFLLLTLQTDVELTLHHHHTCNSLLCPLILHEASSISAKYAGDQLRGPGPVQSGSN